MNISRNDLYRIVLEEYLLEEGHAGTDTAVEDLLKKILGDKYKPPEERDPTRYAKHHGDTKPMEKPHAEEDPEELTGVVDSGETYPIDPDAETPFRSRQPMSADEIATTIGELIHGRDPEEVSEIFQMAFEKLPGVELSSPGDEDYPGEETLYNPGAEGRPSISLGPLRERIGNKAFEKILEVAGLSYGSHSMAGIPGSRDDEEEEEVVEGEYRDLEDEGEVYDVLDPEGLAQKADAELVNMMWTDGMEKMIVLDGEGNLANREEIIVALKDV